MLHQHPCCYAVINMDGCRRIGNHRKLNVRGYDYKNIIPFLDYILPSQHAQTWLLVCFTITITCLYSSKRFQVKATFLRINQNLFFVLLSFYVLWWIRFGFFLGCLSSWYSWSSFRAWSSRSSGPVTVCSCKPGDPDGLSKPHQPCINSATGEPWTAKTSPCMINIPPSLLLLWHGLQQL